MQKEEGRRKKAGGVPPPTLLFRLSTFFLLPSAFRAAQGSGTVSSAA
jgi:hypothetical protein